MRPRLYLRSRGKTSNISAQCSLARICDRFRKFIHPACFCPHPSCSQIRHSHHNYPPSKVLLYTNRKAQIHVQDGTRSCAWPGPDTRSCAILWVFLCVLQMRNQFKVNLTPYFYYFVLFLGLNSCKTYLIYNMQFVIISDSHNIHSNLLHFMTQLMLLSDYHCIVMLAFSTRTSRGPRRR